MSELEKLLSRLPSVEFLTYEGKAVGRDKSHLHLAIASGVIAIPLADISEVTPLSGQSSEIVSVSVKSTDGIKHIRHAIRRVGEIGVGGREVGPGGPHLPYKDCSWSNGKYFDTTTVTGGKADATDDQGYAEECDDCVGI